MYTPRYIDTDDVPVQVPDEYSDQEKADAIEVAETSLEIDVYDGVPIEDEDFDEFSSVLTAALKQKATCELIKGASHPNDVKLGDIQEDTGKEDLAETFCDRYTDLVMKINEAPILENSQSLGAYSYTTDPPTTDYNNR